MTVQPTPARRRALPGAAGLILALVLSACSTGIYEPARLAGTDAADPIAHPGGGGATPDGGANGPAIDGDASFDEVLEAPPLDPPATAWEAVMRMTNRDGSVPLEMALQAYALAIGPLPGVDVPADDAGPVDSGTQVVRWIMRHWDALTAEQQSTVERQLDIRVRGSATAARDRATLAGAFVPVPPVAGPDAEVLADFEAATEEAEARISALLGRSLSGPITVRFGSFEVQEGQRTLALTTGVNAAGERDWGYMDYCDILIGPQGQQMSNVQLQALMYHEVFHCFDWDLTELDEGLKVPPWLGEGAAAWVGEALLPDLQRSTLGADFGAAWLTDLRTPLFQRGYDAMGFFSHMDEQGLSPWEVIDMMLLEGRVSSAAAYEYVANYGVFIGPEVIDTWAPGYFRDLALRPTWDSRGPGLHEDYAPRIDELSIANGETKKITGSPLSVVPVNLQVQAEVIVFRAHAARGMVRFADGSEHELASILGTPLCTKDGGCGSCPTSSAGAGHSFGTAATGLAKLGVTAHMHRVDLEVHGYSVDQACDKSPDDFGWPEDDCTCPQPVLPPLGPTRTQRSLRARRRRLLYFPKRPIQTPVSAPLGEQPRNDDVRDAPGADLARRPADEW